MKDVKWEPVTEAKIDFLIIYDNDGRICEIEVDHESRNADDAQNEQVND